MIYASRETRTLTSYEGWVLGFSFVMVTLVTECGLQLLAGQALPEVQVALDHLTSSSGAALLIGACLLLLGIIITALLFAIIWKAPTQR